MTPPLKVKRVPTYPKHIRMRQLQLRFQLVKQEEGEALTYWKRRKRRRYATLSSNTALGVTCTIVSQDIPPQWTKGIDPNKKKTARGVTFSTNSLQKMSRHNKFNKMQFMQRLHVEWSGITLACSDWWASIVCIQISVWGGKRQREDDIMWEEEKCFAGQLSKKCLIHYFPFRVCAARRAASRHVTVLGPADSLTLAGGDLLRAGQWLLYRSLYILRVCVCARAFERRVGGVLSWSRTFSSNLVQAFL